MRGPRVGCERLGRWGGGLVGFTGFEDEVTYIHGGLCVGGHRSMLKEKGERLVELISGASQTLRVLMFTSNYIFCEEF